LPDALREPPGQRNRDGVGGSEERDDLPTLLAARILQGAVAGPLIPLSQAILLGSYPKEKSSTALALWAMTATVGPIAGPALGGWITDSYSWSWTFYINIPVGLVAAGVTWAIYRDR
jgi:DHA2 family multidrug resistance protein